MNIYENTDSEAESQNETFKDAQTSHVEISPSKSLSVSAEAVPVEEKAPENGSSGSSSRRESVDDLSFAIESDSSLTNAETTSETVLIDKVELENALQYTVKITKDFPVEVLCDIYVQLSRCVGRYNRLYDRRTLPKVSLLNL